MNKSRRRDRSRDDTKSKRSRPRSRSREREKTKSDKKSAPRKTRWQPENEPSKNESISEAVVATKEKSELPLRIKDCLHDKAKTVDLLFQTVTGTALQELIPDYLKKRSIEELKRLCLEQLKKMTDEDVLQIISGKVDSSNKEEKVVVEKKEKFLKPEQSSSPKKKDKEDSHKWEKKPDETVAHSAAILPESETQVKTATSNEAEKITREENEIPLVIKDEIAKDLILHERDAELLELEMRAKAIRSLLKAKSQSPSEEETISKKEK